MTIVFENPPISEVVMATYLNPSLVDFRSQHVGRFWERIRHEFPVVRQQIPVGVGPDIGPEEPFPMPRYWFIAQDEINLVQIQKNAFIFNWRRAGSNRYPRYHREIKPGFDRFYGELETFLRTEVDVPEISIDLCELTYVNPVEQGNYWAGPRDTQMVIPSFSTLSLGAEVSTEPDFNCQFIYTVTHDMQLGVTVRNAVVPQRSNEPALMFEIKASARLGQASKAVADSWFERAHDAIVNCFVGMTSKDIQREYWGRQSEETE